MDTRVKSIEFIEDKHEYWFTDEQGRHRRLYGVTGAIGKLLGKSFPDTDTVKLATMYGSDVHKEIENYFNLHGHFFNDSTLSTDGARWIIQELKKFCNGLILDRADRIECEVMVSDFEGTASKVDIVITTVEGNAYLFDIKTTSHFDRTYCSLQLSVYKRLYEACYDRNVNAMFVLGTKMKRSFRILEQEPGKVNKILTMNHEKTLNK
jgi:hypothetical protein